MIQLNNQGIIIKEPKLCVLQNFRFFATPNKYLSMHEVTITTLHKIAIENKEAQSVSSSIVRICFYARMHRKA